VIGAPVLIQQWSRDRSAGAAPEPNEFVCVFGPIYLVVLAVLWVTALPQYLGAKDGITADGTPIGDFLYAATSFLIAALAVFSVVTVSRSRLSAEVGEYSLPS
jgi:hypothetical protein